MNFYFEFLQESSLSRKIQAGFNKSIAGSGKGAKTIALGGTPNDAIDGESVTVIYL